MQANIHAKSKQMTLFSYDCQVFYIIVKMRDENMEGLLAKLTYTSRRHKQDLYFPRVADPTTSENPIYVHTQINIKEINGVWKLIALPKCIPV